jgi:hypothetical protein
MDATPHAALSAADKAEAQTAPLGCWCFFLVHKQLMLPLKQSPLDHGHPKRLAGATRIFETSSFRKLLILISQREPSRPCNPKFIKIFCPFGISCVVYMSNQHHFEEGFDVILAGLHGQTTL